jgi:hypothetical protein
MTTNHKEINWNKGTYSVYTDLLTNKDYKLIKDAEREYINILHNTCEKINKKVKDRTLRSLKAFVKPLLTKTEYKACERFIWIF